MANGNPAQEAASGGSDSGTINIEIQARGVEKVAVDGQTVAQSPDTAGGGSGPSGGEVDASDAVATAFDKLTEAVSELWDGAIQHLPQMAIAVVVIIITAIVARMAHNAARKLFGTMKLKASLRDLFSQFVYIGAWFVGILVAAGIVFPDFGFGQLVATAGLASIAIGFAFQDIFENFFAGILILWRFPFEIGDYIDVEGTDIEGQVEDIWIRMTHLRKTTGELLLVPNATVYKHPVRVLTNQTKRRTTIMAGIAYSEDVDEGREVIRKAVEGCETVKQDEPIQIFAQGFGASSIDYEVTWWTDPTPLDIRRSTDEVVAAVKRGLDEAGIEIPFPYRTLTFRDDSPLRMLRDQTPGDDES